MSAAEEDTELRDLLIHTLENNGVLNKIKAELRASVFLALEEQEESKPALINERLRQFLATSDGRLLACLLTDFLQHFHLDFTLAVLQPEACLPSTPDQRASAARELGLSVSEAPLLLELLRLRRQREAAVPQELPLERTEQAQARYRQRVGPGGELGQPELRALLLELCPHFHRGMLDTYITEQLAGLSGVIDEQRFLALYRGLFLHCRSVVVGDYTVSGPQPSLQLDDEDDLEGDSFFDDPIPKPERTYGWKEEVHPGATHSQGSLSGSRKGSDQDRDGSLRSTSEKMASLEIGAAQEEDYMDDFHSSSQKSEASIGEDLEEELSVDELTASDHKLEELTLDNSISQLSDVADYLEDVS
ncbi:centrosomal protein 43 [Phyllobates terribilis]|uniref:centrosomal protein 43 n=1 Tax=Phyllobates terribilis TaxID=111132 RepID=UPI003CCB157B